MASQKKNATGQKAASKGTIFSCVKDADKNKKLSEEIEAFVSTKGKGYTPKKLMERFHALGYENVSLADATSVLASVQELKHPDTWDWHY